MLRRDRMSHTHSLARSSPPRRTSSDAWDKYLFLTAADVDDARALQSEKKKKTLIQLGQLIIQQVTQHIEYILKRGEHRNLTTLQAACEK